MATEGTAGPADSPRPRVSVLAMGGTIAMSGERGRDIRPALAAGDLLAALPGIEDVARISARSVTCVPGPHMDLALIDRLAGEVESELSAGADGVVITQGTDTIEESAFALELMLDTDAPIVVTGAMRPPEAAGADGEASLLQAIALAASREGRGLGVCVLMDGDVQAPRFVTKAHTNAMGAFDPGPVLLGRVTEDRVMLLATLGRLPATGWCRDTPPAGVALAVAALGEQGEMLDCLMQAGYDGLVIAGMGGGHVHPAMAGRIGTLAARCPVVVATRTGDGSTLAHTYGYAGGEIHLAGVGAIRAGWLSPLKARIALSLLLGAGRTTDQIRDFFTAFDGG